MVNFNLIQKLKDRGLILQLTNEKSLIKKLNKKKNISLYCGFDPTSDSLHLGHLIPLLCLKHFQLANHRPIILIGGATASIGDPSFKINKRRYELNLNIKENIEKIKNQVSTFLDFNCGDNSAIIVNNYDWFHSMDVLTFFSKIGKYFSINNMINKEYIQKRLNFTKVNMSFDEFSYVLLQSYDFVKLNEDYNVVLQIGGSDQWGNIISGINLTYRILKKNVYGLTVPLITKKDGTKFSKTEKDTIWLDSSKTSPYKFYQFWININDKNIFHFFNLFTLLEQLDISNLKNKKSYKNEIMYCKYILAEEVTRIVHGKGGLESAKRITRSLFKNEIINLTEKDFAQLVQDGLPTTKLKGNINLQSALVTSKMAISNRDARHAIISNSIAINGKKETLPKYVFNDFDRIYNHYTLIKRGKKNFCLLFWE